MKATVMLLALVLAGCSTFSSTEDPPSPPTARAEQATTAITAAPERMMAYAEEKAAPNFQWTMVSPFQMRTQLGPIFTKK